MTTKQFNVLKYLVDNNHSSRHPIHGRALTPVIFDEETIKKYSHARTRKVVIETMTHSYLGRIQSKGLVNIGYKTIRYSKGDSYTYYEGVNYTELGKQEYLKQINHKK